MTKKQYNSYFSDDDDQKYECRKCRKCNICDKVIPISQTPLQCVICDRRVHTNCNKFEKKDYQLYQNDDAPDFYCLKCLASTFPFQSLDNNHFHLANKAINCPNNYDAKEIELTLTQKNMIKKLNTAIETGIHMEVDDDDINPINCKYYSTEEFNKKKFNPVKHFSILHLNIHYLL